MLITNEKDFSSFENGIKKEWIIANGIGGYSSSTIIGANTRKYHGLLVAALDENYERFLVLSRLNEEIEMDKKTYSISSNECPGYIENGFKYQKCFAKEYLPEFFYDVKGVQIIKKIGIVHGENKVAVTYTIKTGNNNVKFKLSPIINFRNFHETKDLYRDEQAIGKNTVKIRLSSKHNLYMTISEGEYIKYYNTYYQNMIYREEKARGLDYCESHYMPGAYEISLMKNEEKMIEFVASVDDKLEFDLKPNAESIIKSEETRMQKVCKIYGTKDDVEKNLAIAADSFVIEKGYGKTIIAGYHWFSDWGRDTFIALEGILLKANRFIDAKNIILTFSKNIRNGLVPNLIGEDGGQSYNSVDASLWFINAVYKYYKYTGDTNLVSDVYDKLLEIIEAYKNGTDYEIKMDDDGLITEGNKNTQLTWMDAKVGDYVPTPRNGKAVEINALWYNALNVMKRFSEILEKDFDKELIGKVKESFKVFYKEHGLYDTVKPFSDKIRPNQIFAVSLDFPILDTEKANDVVDVIEEELLTDKGLKTLNAGDEDYRARYEGDVYNRDASYHEGTVWPWLMMGYYEACYKLKRKPKILLDVNQMLEDRCIGSICEIYDADEPRRANGAISQAWSVAMAILYL